MPCLTTAPSVHMSEGKLITKYLLHCFHTTSTKQVAAGSECSCNHNQCINHHHRPTTNNLHNHNPTNNNNNNNNNNNTTTQCHLPDPKDDEPTAAVNQRLHHWMEQRKGQRGLGIRGAGSARRARRIVRGLQEPTGGGKLGRVKEKNKCVFVSLNMLFPSLTKSFPHHRKPIKK
jgi:hypothetical protein